MQLDKDYLKDLLLTFEDMPSPRPCLSEIINSGYTVDKQFVLHLEVLGDYGFIEGLADNGTLGIVDYEDDDIGWINAPLRLTAQGHEFIEAIKKKEVWEIIKKEFKESSIETIFKVSKELAQKIAKKKLNELLAEV